MLIIFSLQFYIFRTFFDRIKCISFDKQLLISDANEDPKLKIIHGKFPSDNVLRAKSKCHTLVFVCTHGYLYFILIWSIIVFTHFCLFEMKDLLFVFKHAFTFLSMMTGYNQMKNKGLPCLAFKATVSPSHAEQLRAIPRALRDCVAKSIPR